MDKHVFFVEELCYISRTKSCHEAELKKKETHLQWERENERRRMRKEELEKELQRQVLSKSENIPLIPKSAQTHHQAQTCRSKSTHFSNILCRC